MHPRVLLIALVFSALACDAGGDPGGAADTDTDSGTDGVASETGTSGASANSASSSWGSTAETTPWNIDTEDPPATTSPITTGAATGEETDGGEETEGGGETDGKAEEDFIGWFGYGAVVPGVSYDAQGEVIVFTGGVDHCILIWSATSVPSDACAECEGAFTMTIGNVDAEVEEDCSLVGTDAQMLAGSTLGVGWSGEELYVDFGKGFSLAEGGFAEYVEERQEFFWELPLEE